MDKKNKMKIKKIKKIFIVLFGLILMLAGFILGIMTFLPDNASKTCLIGYYAHCSFAPISSVILLTLGLLGLILIIIMFRKNKREPRS
jgi:hypothetical protein